MSLHEVRDHMEFRDLIYVTRLAQYQNYTDAAKSLHISQPALTKCIKRLESDYGEPFFVRKKNRTVPTEYGNLFVHYAELILSQKAQMEMELEKFHQKNFPTLRIAVTPVSGRFHISQTAIPFQRIAPNVSLQFVEGITLELYELIRKGEADIGICVPPGFPLPEVPELNSIPIHDQEIILAVPADHPVMSMVQWKPGFRYPWVSLQWLRNEKFLLQSENQYPTIAAKELFQEEGFEPVNIYHVPNVHSAIDLACAGCGVAVITDFHLRVLEQRSKLVGLSAGSRPRRYMTSAVFRKDLELTRYMLDYIELVKSAYRKVYEE